MKRGRLKVIKNNVTKKWEIHGKDNNNIYSLVTFEGKNLIFDLEYDACAYLEMWAVWEIENRRYNNVKNQKKEFSLPSFSKKNRRKRNVKNKMVKKSKKENRNK